MTNYSLTIKKILTDSKRVKSEQSFLNIRTLHEKLEDKSKSLKTTERSLSDLNFLPKKLKNKDLFDENFKNLNQIVKEYWINKAEKKRVTVLIAQVEEFDKKLYLFVQDGRGSFNWVKVSHKQLDKEETISKILEEILGIYSGNIYLWPHGKLVSHFRKYFAKKSSEEIFIGKRSITIPLSAYYSSFNSGIELQSEFFSRNSLSLQKKGSLSHIDLLEAESIHIMREVVAESKNPVMLYSLGKDSSVMLHLAQKAFHPGKLPFPLLHVDTKWKFKEMYEFRDMVKKNLDSELIVYSNQEGLDKNINPIDHGSSLHTNIMKTEALKLALDKYKFDFAFGGARRDEEKSRAKERIFSLRSDTHTWDPKNQRPELWNKFNCKLRPNENVRVFPLSNWTELDIWHYIYREKIQIIPLYFSKPRPITYIDQTMIMVDDERLKINSEEISIKNIRFRTLGCYPLSGAIESSAQDLESVINEIIESRFEERQGRKIDTDTDSSMEKKKIEGYF
ncbi:MAG: sulfate adenylyltransferase subunit CysD [Gammaproteobacteria bacterium]|tara:strand:- start:2904 stop:4421 length:1518 start_codon:yes stop_codon:yes gene_type:complete